MRHECIYPSPLPGYDRIKSLMGDELRDLWAVRERASGKLYILVIQKTALPEHTIIRSADERHRFDHFGRELLIEMRLNHPNLGHAREAGKGDGCTYYLEELFPGDSADARRIKRGGKLPLAEATWIILQALSGLACLHDAAFDIETEGTAITKPRTVHVRGLVHGDIKPDNLMLMDETDRPVVQIAALDAARLIGIETFGSGEADEIVGSPAFMPRQQVLHADTVGPEADVWAAAASYYYLLTGTAPKPFSPGKNAWQVILQESAVPIRKRDKTVPKPLAAVIDRALRDDPEIGYQTAAALRADIIAALPDDVLRAVAPLMG